MPVEICMHANLTDSRRARLRLPRGRRRRVCGAYCNGRCACERAKIAVNGVLYEQAVPPCGLNACVGSALAEGLG